MTSSIRRFDRRDAAMAAAWLTAGAIGATVLTGVAFAAGDSTTPPTTTPSSPSATDAPDTAPDGSTAPNNGKGFGPGGRFGHGGPGGMGGDGIGKGLGRVLHGDVTVTDKDGAAKQVRVQRGELTAVSATSLTVKSSDGYESTWTINADTTIRRDRETVDATKLVVGDTVNLTGPLSGDTATATFVRALSADEAAKVEKEMAEREAEREARKNSDGNSSDDDSSTQGSNSSNSTSFAEYSI